MDRHEAKLPDPCHAIGVEAPVEAHNRKPLDQSLGDEHPIEWIAARAQQTPGALCVDHRDVEGEEPLAFETAQDIGRNLKGSWQLPDRSLDADFPCRGRTDKDLCRLVRDRFSRARRESFVGVEPPEKRVRV